MSQVRSVKVGSLGRHRLRLEHRGTGGSWGGAGQVERQRQKASPDWTEVMGGGPKGAAEALKRKMKKGGTTKQTKTVQNGK